MEKQSNDNRRNKILISSSQHKVRLRKTLNQKELENLIFKLHLDNTNLFVEVLNKNIESYSDFFKIFDQHRLFLMQLKKHLFSKRITATNINSKKTTDQIYNILKTYFKEYYQLSSSNWLLRKTWDSFFEKWLLHVDTENTSPQKMLKLSDDIMRDLNRPKPGIEFNYMFIINPILLKR